MFYIQPIDKGINPKVKDVLDKQASTSPIVKNTNEFKCLLYPKQLIKAEEVFYEHTEGWIFGTGTWSYKDFTGRKALKLILEESLINRFDGSLLKGQFILTISIDGELKLLADPTGIMNIYKSENGIISSSFLSVLYSFDIPCSINKLAIKEALCTGNLVSPDTLVNEIKRFHPRYVDDFSTQIKIYLSQEIEDNVKKVKFRNDALEIQTANMDKLLMGFKSLADRNNTDIGITGGLDSRLLWSFVLNNWDSSRLNIYTNSRKDKTNRLILDEPIAEKVANAINLSLKLGWMKDPNTMEDDEIKDTIHSAYIFSDAHVRMHIQYFEEYNTFEFKKRVLNMTNSTFNLSGIGGEQYRNQEYFLGNKWNGKKFVKYKALKFISGKATANDDIEFLNYLYDKVKLRLGIHKNYWSHIEVKKYYNEIINAERLGARNNMENRISWFLSPFADHTVSNEAYRITKFLKTSPDFQADLLKENSESLAAIYTDYGFIPADGIPFKIKILNLIKAAIPWRILYLFRERFIFSKNKNSLFEKIKNKPSITKPLEILEQTMDDININELLKRSDTMPIAVNMGYFLMYELKNKTIIV